MHKACCREGYVFCCWTSSFKFLVRAKEEGSVSLLYSRRIQRTLEYFHEVNLQCNIVREIWFATQGVELRCRLVLVEPSGSVPFLTCLVEMERSGAISQNRVFALDLEPMHSKNLSELNRSCFFHRFCHPAALLMPTKTASSCPVATVLCPAVAPPYALLLRSSSRGGHRVAEKKLVLCSSPVELTSMRLAPSTLPFLQHA
jgi:hypothetical protein